MIRSLLGDDILIITPYRVELHDQAGHVLWSRAPTPEEAALVAAAPATYEPLIREEQA